jgi:hypothetical protein
MTDRMQLQCLTECFPLHTNAYEDATTTRLARAFGAFKIAVGKLYEYYKNLNSISRNKLQTPERDGRVAFPHPNSYEVEGKDIEFEYNSRFSDTKLIFVATTTTERTKVLVKFTRRYSVEAHQVCADAGVAPSLLGFRSLGAGWYMVVMEYLPPETYRVLGPRDGSKLDLKAEIWRAVKVLHDGGFVHGDIRDVNMMTRHQWSSEENARNVLLLDFDWAGRQGEKGYPPNVNPAVGRHKEAKDGALIMQEHDRFMVDRMLVATASV